MIFGLTILATFFAMEAISIVLHRYLFHGPLWFIHASHHKAKSGIFETNDLFTTIFSLAAIGFFLLGKVHWSFTSIAIGITAYGLAYLVVHDLYVHRRFSPISLPGAWVKKVRERHRFHHQLSTKQGQGPYGLFFRF